MELFGIGPLEFLLILVLALVILGPERLPEVARSISKTVRDLRRMSEELSKELDQFNLEELIEPTDEGESKATPAEAQTIAPPEARSSTIAEPAASTGTEAPKDAQETGAVSAQPESTLETVAEPIATTDTTAAPVADRDVGTTPEQADTRDVEPTSVSSAEAMPPPEPQITEASTAPVTEPPMATDMPDSETAAALHADMDTAPITPPVDAAPSGNDQKAELPPLDTAAMSDAPNPEAKAALPADLTTPGNGTEPREAVSS